MMASERKRRSHRRHRAKMAAARALARTPLGVAPVEYLHMETPPNPVQNGRARCPGCGRREKVKTDGTFGRHPGLDKKTDCEGTGVQP